MEDIIKIHSKVCPNFEQKVQVSLDGLSEAKSSTVSMDVYSSKFHKCRSIYPHKIVRPLNKQYVDNQEQLRNFVFDIVETCTSISEFVADNPKRANIRCCLSHNSLFPCEYCFARGAKYTIKKTRSEKSDITKKLLSEKIKKLEKLKDKDSQKALVVLRKLLKEVEKTNGPKGSQMTVWPSCTYNKPLRTKSNMIEIVEKLENQESDDPLSREELKGVIGHSIMLDLEYFDFVHSIPTEYMHLVCLGVVKRLTELTFNVGLNRPRNSKRKLSSTKEFNFLMSQTIK